MNRIANTGVALGGLLLLSHCGDSTAPERHPAASVSLSPDSVSLHVNQVLQMHLTALDAAGDTLDVDSASWQSSDPSVLTVSSSGLVTARAAGVAFVSAHVDTASGAAYLRVLVPVSSLELSPRQAFLVPGGAIQITAVLRDVNNNILSDRDITWTHRTDAISIDPGGLVSALHPGRDSITAISEGIGAYTYTIATITEPRFTRVISSDQSLNTCATTTDARLYCWGYNVYGQLGTGVFGGISPFPTGVLNLSSVTAAGDGNGTMCAVDSAALFCWGNALGGQLGIDDDHDRALPTRISMPVSATTVADGVRWGCALGTDSVAYCWGDEIGAPTPRSIGHKYLAIDAGYYTLCGIKADSLAYCGSATAGSQVLVPSSPKFTKLSVASSHKCGIGVDSTAYCWGENSQGQLGDSTTVGRGVPAPVHGGRKFVDISAGDYFTCGIVAGGTVYCWGRSDEGGLGRPDSISTFPVPINSTIAFTQVVAATAHACGLSIQGKVYCWGGNRFGQLGDGTYTSRFTPALVLGQQP